MGFSSLNLVGNQQIALFGLPDTTRRHKTGLVIQAVDPYWGGAELVYCYASASIRQGGLVTILPTIQSDSVRFEATEVGNTANLGSPLGVAMTSATVGQYIWAMVYGVIPVNCNASVAANTTFGIAAAGSLNTLTLYPFSTASFSVSPALENGGSINTLYGTVPLFKAVQPPSPKSCDFTILKSSSEM